MLLPKTTIFIVYGHDFSLLEKTKKAIENLIKNGYRIKYQILDEEKLRTEKKIFYF